MYQAHALDTMSIDARWFEVNLAGPRDTHEIIEANKAC
jgi:hypothetical protein